MSGAIKESLQGEDVFTCTPEQASFDDSYPPMKIEEDKWGLVTYTFPGDISDTVLFTIPHGYSYTPAALVFGRDRTVSNNYGLVTTPFDVYDGVNDYGYQYIDTYCDATNLYIRYTNLGGGGDHYDPTGRIYDFKYYIFAETGS